MGLIPQWGLLCFGILPILLSSAIRLPCYKTGMCECTQHTSEKNEFWCYVNKSQVIIEIRPNVSVQLTCDGFKDSSYLDALEDIKSSRNVQRFVIKQCPIPDRSFDEVFKLLDVESVKEFTFDYPDNKVVSFKQSHFQNLGTLEKLFLWGNNISELPEDVFEDVANLKRLYLNLNDFQKFPIKIFEPLTKLETLDLGKNNLTTLDSKIFQYLAKLHGLNLNNNRLDDLSKSVFASLIQLKSLDLSSNNITRLKDGTFDKLSKLENLNLNYNDLTRIPDKLFVNNGKLNMIKLTTAFSREISTLPGALFAHLTNLEILYVDANKLVSLPGDLLYKCVNLKKINLRKNSLKTLPSTLFKDTKNVEEINLGENNLDFLDEELFNDLKKLTKLKLDRNHLTNIASGLFANLISLKHLQLNENKLVDFKHNTFDGLKNLTNINLSHNRLTLEGWKLIGISPLNKCISLEWLNLTNNLLTMVFDDWRSMMSKLKTLDLSFNRFENLTTSDFVFTSVNFPVTVNFSNNRIKTIRLFMLESTVYSQCEPFPCSRTDRVPTEFILENNPIHCDCEVFHLAKYFQNKMPPMMKKYITLRPHLVTCHSPETLRNVPLEHVDLMELKCPLVEIEKKLDQDCPDNCSCFYRPMGNTIIVNCTAIGTDRLPERIPPATNRDVELLFANNRLKSLDGLSNLAKMARIARLSVSSNKLKSIDDIALPRTLRILELDHNEITSMNNRTITQLNSSGNLTNLTLHKNPWDCDCDTKYFLNFIRDQYRKIPRYQDIQCKESGHSIINLTEDDLCYTSFVIMLTFISLGIFGLVFGGAIAVYYAYQHEIKVWMFAHKICLWLVAEKELDKDKIYDAFVSFSHKDQEFVDKTLIPQLEKNNDHKYKLCIHYRDFIVGEFIPSQIVHSVENSKRTIIVLTPNFLESIWGRMEFRTAHLKAIKEGCARVIIIMLQDVSNEKLDPELKAYITMNTYVKWGDPLFWEKLRYALPHPQAYIKQRTSNVAPLSEAELKKKKLFNLDEIIKSTA